LRHVLTGAEYLGLFLCESDVCHLLSVLVESQSVVADVEVVSNLCRTHSREVLALVLVEHSQFWVFSVT
jgi:hypothetical protein